MMMIVCGPYSSQHCLLIDGHVDGSGDCLVTRDIELNPGCLAFSFGEHLNLLSLSLMVCMLTDASPFLSIISLEKKNIFLYSSYIPLSTRHT